MSALRPALLGVPWDENSSYLRGAAGAPPLIRQALWCESSNSWGENGIELTRETLVDAGDVAPGAGAAMLDAIEMAVGELLDRGHSPICLGGDHAITYPRAPGLRAPLSLGSRSCTSTRTRTCTTSTPATASRTPVPSRGSWRRGWPRRLVQVGLRTINRHQREQAARFGVEMVEMREFRDDFDPAFETPVYVTFDLDGLDPSCAPGVSHPEPGGLTTRQALDLIYRLNTPIVGADVVELNPVRDLSGMTARVAGKLVKEIAARMLEESGDRGIGRSGHRISRDRGSDDPMTRFR